MSQNTNMYYSQYASSIESEPNYDSDNPEVKQNLDLSNLSFRKILNHRKEGEKRHETWKRRIREDHSLTDRVEIECGMLVRLADEYVCFKYHPEINGKKLHGYCFRIMVTYIRLLRTWILSPGRSLVPPVISLEGRLENGVHNPIGRNMLKLIQQVREETDVYMQRLHFVFSFIEKVREEYRDLVMEVNQEQTELQMVFDQESWPRGIGKTCSKDALILKLVLDDDYQVETIVYNHISNKKNVRFAKECQQSIEERLRWFFKLPLEEAFERFMN